MLKKLVPADQPEKGHYNEAPENWRQITEKEFIRCDLHIWGWQYTERRWILRDANGDLKDSRGVGYGIRADLYWMHAGHGYAIARNLKEERFDYYRFGCEHKYVGLSQQTCRERGIFHAGRCYHVSECQNCGHVMSVDSSD